MLAPFHRDAVARQAGLMAEIAAANIAGWPVGKRFAVAPKMSEITLEVILRTVIGATDPARLAALREVMPQLLNVGPWETLALANPNLQQRRPWRGLRRRIAEADGCSTPRSPTVAPTRPGRTHRRAGDAGSRRRRRRTHDDRPRTARPADDAAGGRARHHRDGAVLGAGAADPPPGRRWPRRCGGRGQRGGRPGRRRVSRRGGQGDAADPSGGVRRGPGADRAGRGGRLPAAGRGHGGPRNRAGARERRRCTRIPTGSTRIGCSARP